MYILCCKSVNTGNIFLLDAKTCCDQNFFVNIAKIKVKYSKCLIHHHAMKAYGGVTQDGAE
jgi:hypothetical protein